MSFAIPTTDPAVIRCAAIIDRLANYRPGSQPFDEGWRHGSEWIGRAEGIRHPHPFVALEGDAIIRALVEDHTSVDWHEQAKEWMSQLESARRCQGWYRQPVICLPECSDFADLAAANID